MAAKTTTAKGLGWEHQQQRERLLRAHVDGTLCWWCDRPMYRDRTRNWDHDPQAADNASGSLAADHTHARAHGGTRADRLLHGRCNKQRQDGRNDHQRPAIAPDTESPLGHRAMAWPDVH